MAHWNNIMAPLKYTHETALVKKKGGNLPSCMKKKNFRRVGTGCGVYDKKLSWATCWWCRKCWRIFMSISCSLFYLFGQVKIRVLTIFFFLLNLNVGNKHEVCEFQWKSLRKYELFLRKSNRQQVHSWKSNQSSTLTALRFRGHHDWMKPFWDQILYRAHIHKLSRCNLFYFKP